MLLDYKRYLANCTAYRESDDYEKLLAKQEGTIISRLLSNLLGILLSLILICTIKFTKLGFTLLYELLKNIVSLRVFRLKSNFRKHLEKVQPMILSDIMIGPTGYGLGLGYREQNSESDWTYLGQKAEEFGLLYTFKSEHEKDSEMIKLLEQDQFVPGRRRLVPASHSDGNELLLFDLEMDLKETHMSDSDLSWLACLSLTWDEMNSDVPRGEIMQIPWSVVDSARLT